MMEFNSVVVNTDNEETFKELVTASSQRMVDDYISYYYPEIKKHGNTYMIVVVVISDKFDDFDLERTIKTVKAGMKEVEIPKGTDPNIPIKCNTLFARTRSHDLSMAVNYVLDRRIQQSKDNIKEKANLMFPLTCFVGFDKGPNYDQVLQKVQCSVILFNS